MMKQEVRFALSTAAATTAGVGSGSGGSITPESMKSKRFTLIATVADPDDPAVKRPKTQEGNKTMSYEVPNDQFRPQMLLPNRCYVSKSDSLMEVPQLGFQLNKGFTLPRNITFRQPLDDTSLICTGVVSTLRVSFLYLGFLYSLYFD